LNVLKKIQRDSAILIALLATWSFAQAQPVVEASSEVAPGLRDAVVLIIRHAEKPQSGTDLSEAGRQRAQAYVNYFQNFTIDGKPAKPDYLFATADSAGSHRPRLTIEPLSKALGLKIDNRFKNKDFKSLAEDIRLKPHGKCILIAWHHREIGELVGALGADASKLLPDGAWPDDTFDWVLELRYDHDGRLIPAETKRIDEKLMPDDSKQ
jgi:hypothetical protein